MELKKQCLEKAREQGLEGEELAYIGFRLDLLLGNTAQPRVDWKKRRRENRRAAMEKCHRETGSWHEVYVTCMYADEPEYSAIFVALLEEAFGEKVGSPEDLERLTDIRVGETDSREGLRRTLIEARHWSYLQALESCLQAGGKYADLMKMDPADYGLPPEWSVGGEDNFAPLRGKRGMMPLPHCGVKAGKNGTGNRLFLEPSVNGPAWTS